MKPFFDMSLLIAFGFLSLLLLLGVLLRAKIKFLQNFMVPACLTGGVIGFFILNTTGFPQVQPELSPALAYLSDFRRREDLELAYDAGTYGSASVLGLPDYGLSEGCWADMVVFPVENRACALLEGPMPRFVIKRGVLVARDGELTDAVPPCPE